MFSVIACNSGVPGLVVCLQFSALTVHTYTSLSTADRESLCRRPAVMDSERLMKIVSLLLLCCLLVRRLLGLQVIAALV